MDTTKKTAATKTTKTMPPPPMKKRKKLSTAATVEAMVELTADEHLKNESRISHIIWEKILQSAYENTGEMLKDAQGRYNRGLLFSIVRDYVTEMMVYKGDITFNCKHGSLTVHCARFNQIQSDKIEKEIISNVQKVINRWTTGKGEFKKQMSNYPTTHLKEDQAWENQKEQIMQHIIEPFLQRQEERDAMSQIVVPPTPPQQPLQPTLMEKSITAAASPLLEKELLVEKNNEDEFINTDDDDDEENDFKRVKRQLYE